jgi:hypothetical protein
LHTVNTGSESIPDPAVRASYLTQVPENARARELARQWLPDAPAT